MFTNSWYKYVLVIDRSIWRNGNEGVFAHGLYHTQLHNTINGMECCLGQACIQLGLTVEKISNKYTPLSLHADLKNTYLDNVQFADKAMSINDNQATSRACKELELFIHGRKNEIYVKFIGKYSDEPK